MGRGWRMRRSRGCRKASIGFGVALSLLGLGRAEAQFAPVIPSVAASDSLGGLALTQRGIPAEASAENGVVARDRALASGRRIAWERALAEAGLPPSALPDARIEDLVSSIVIEQERALPTRYSGRITVNFDPARVQAALGGAAAASPGGGVPGGGVQTPAPASNWLEVVATYRGMGEWVEIQRRLKAAGTVASVDIKAIAIDAARLRLGLRAPAAPAAESLSADGLSLVPAIGPRPGESWRLSLARGG